MNEAMPVLSSCGQVAVGGLGWPPLSLCMSARMGLPFSIGCGESSTMAQAFTPRRFGRLPLPLRANVRVGPPAMALSVRRFLRQHESKPCKP